MKIIIHKGFELFLQRDLSDKVDFENFQRSNQITLPPVYKLFLSSFLIGRNIPLKNIEYHNPKFTAKGILGCMECSLDPENIGIGNFFSLEESIEVYKNLYINDSSFDSKSFYPIADDNTGHNMFLVGIGEANADKIYFESPDESYNNQRINYLSHNIFEFIRTLELKEKEEGIGFGIQYNQLYKNWEEDFWRVKD